MDEPSQPRSVLMLNRQRLVDDFFKVDAVEYRMQRYAGGMSEPVRRLILERGDSVAALLVQGDRAWLVEQFRIAACAGEAAGAKPGAAFDSSGWLLETVAGIVGPGETPEQALRREVMEETGFALAALRPVGSFYLSPGGSSERVHLFIAEVAGAVGPGGGVPSEGEDIRLVEFSQDELRRAWRDGRLVDAKTLIAVMAYLGAQP